MDAISELRAERKRLKKQEERKAAVATFALAIFLIVATATAYHFAAPVPDSINQKAMNGALRHSAKEMVK